MAYTTINNPGDYFSVTNWTGNAGANAITGVGFTPNLLWAKSRSNVNSHAWFDTANASSGFSVSSSNNAAQYNQNSDGFGSMDSDGYTWTGDGGGGGVNSSGLTYAGWNWNAATNSGKTTTGETITPTSYAISAASGFGIYRWNGTAGTGAIAHGLNSAPKWFVVKRTDGVANWYAGGSVLTSGDYSIYFNDTDAETNAGSALWQSNFPSSTLMYLGTDGDVNGASRTFVMYAFAEVKGFSAIGTYQGNGNSDGPYINCGFSPEFVFIKNIGASEAWNSWDGTAPGYNVVNNNLQPNATTAQQTSSAGVKEIDFNSSGFKVRGSNTELNQDATTHMYVAVAKTPCVNSPSSIEDAVPGNAR